MTVMGNFRLRLGRTVGSAILPALAVCLTLRLFAQSLSPENQSARRAALPRPAVALTAGTWKYKVTAVQPDGTYNGNDGVTIEDAGRAWTVTYVQEIPAGKVTYVQTLEKSSLIERKLSLDHFAKPGRPWPIVINLDLSDNGVTGTSTRASGQKQPVWRIRPPIRQGFETARPHLRHPGVGSVVYATVPHCYS